MFHALCFFPNTKRKVKEFQGMSLILYCWDESDRTFWNLLAPQNTSSHDHPSKKKKKKKSKTKNLQTNQQKNPVERFVIMVTERLRYRDDMLKTCLRYRLSSRPVSVTNWEHNSKIKIQTQDLAQWFESQAMKKENSESFQPTFFLYSICAMQSISKHAPFHSESVSAHSHQFYCPSLL